MARVLQYDYRMLKITDSKGPQDTAGYDHTGVMQATKSSMCDSSTVLARLLWPTACCAAPLSRRPTHGWLQTRPARLGLRHTTQNPLAMRESELEAFTT